MHVVEAFGGGVFEMVRRISDQVADNGDAVLIAYGIRPETPDDLSAEIDPRVELVPMPWTRRDLLSQIRALRRLRGLYRTFAPDIVHLHSSFAGVVGAVALRDALTIYTPNAYSFTMAGRSRWRRLVYREAERFVARHVTLTGAASESEAELARQVARAEWVETVCNGIPELDDGAQAPPMAKPTPPRVMALGRTVRQRRPVEAAHILRGVADLAEVEWVGGGYPRSLGFKALREAEVPLTGWVPRQEALKRLSDATVYLHWTEWDGLPFSVLEAMAMDAVVVASDIPPNREILGSEQVCQNEDQAAALVRRILTDVTLRKSLLDRQRTRRGNYGADRMTREWAALYRAVLSGERTAAMSR